MYAKIVVLVYCSILVMIHTTALRLSCDVFFCLCSEFTGNQAKSQGAFLTFRFRVEFVRSNLFSYNEGGAMLVFQTKVDTSGRLEFWANTAYMGGAVTLEDQSLVRDSTPSLSLTSTSNA